ncbi:uncharacterized protein [Physcomitrium patens]|uniref:Uncharacterized protein n=1 Tax=Physcomitrium patens TaxID=3218 RepID=A0A2K1K2C3_PHYPA|nr:hypothetical protein PHYPA_012396 [Physcomitrium patens]
MAHLSYSPLQNEFGDDSDDDFDFDFETARRERGSSRQEYLRSYTFTRKPTTREKMKNRLERVKATAWAMVSWNCNGLPHGARWMKKKLALQRPRSLSHGGQRLPRPICTTFMPQCFLAV